MISTYATLLWQARSLLNPTLKLNENALALKTRQQYYSDASGIVVEWKEKQAEEKKAKERGESIAVAHLILSSSLSPEKKNSLELTKNNDANRFQSLSLPEINHLFLWASDNPSGPICLIVILSFCEQILR